MRLKELRLVVYPEDGLRRLRHGGKYTHIAGVPVPPNAPPYALAATPFRFPALAALAGRAPLGGQREVALATYLAARLVQDTLPERGVSPATRTERAANARTWLSTLAVPSAVKPALAKLVESSAGTPDSAGQAVRMVTAVTENFLDSGSRFELEQLAASLGAGPGS
jgi:hypothetical protein